MTLINTEAKITVILGDLTKFKQGFFCNFRAVPENITEDKQVCQVLTTELKSCVNSQWP